MFVSRNCGKIYVNVVVKLLLSTFLFVFMVQLTYLHTYRVEENRSDHTQQLTRSPNNEDLTDSIEPEPHVQRDNTPPLKYFPDLFFKPPHQPLLYGKPRRKKGYLTIGIPSVQRPNTERIYLYDTLDSILEKMPENEHQQITLVVMVSDANKTYNNELSTSVYKRYKAFCDHGIIHVINTVDCIYPDLDNVKRTFNDSQARLKWRAKQNIDFAFMMLYSRNVSEFYIQLEDDVIVATDFIQDIRNVIASTSQTWFLLEFSRLGFIGKLFRSSDLEFVSMFLLKHYDLAPCDLLLGTIRLEKGQKKPIHTNNSLFQHIGKFSSLKNKLMPSVDNTFKDVSQIDLYEDLPLGDNPPAQINTSMIIFDGHIPNHAYDNNKTTYFWAKTPRKRDHFTLTFEKPCNFSRIIITSGERGTKKDSFLASALLYSVSTPLEASDRKHACVNKFLKLVSLVDGEIDTKATGTSIPSNIKCLRISATKVIKNWIIIRDIQLFLKK
ncbi:alpha-1,3-mannosyl-glycoprotein 4-beta-N-acetylglucosaminyltransferase C-like [Mercenaria mercenaria]|uniref:alpha-1,3-mannosyl-glycoprotein 4-beta-N-acetylglucosaminyltransferase C-like n=1 Tax=Mercenaria mercenaria TaxID=6596 RepID=UPI00234F0B8B|nr:alpha-1,3-mannosyl-glycoprotein 4-beta-N-acetylglucosaminyltransferase C-like [Mercenaria mercenaria]XP_045174879.2 alpha-1,3-mannosyl-glycoprotein 4-beta-N-acetylglucosaminyltransferase C-like [Mercenaria mercenaria]